jgi:hypothetical protein
VGCADLGELTVALGMMVLDAAGGGACACAGGELRPLGGAGTAGVLAGVDAVLLAAIILPPEDMTRPSAPLSTSSRRCRDLVL